MLKRFTFTMTVIASLTGLYWLYALTVTPRLAPKLLTAQQRPLEVRDESNFKPPPSNIENAERHLPDAAWASEAKFQIAMANGVLFTNSWRLVEEAQQGEDPPNLYEFRPFAMIWFDDRDGESATADRQPMTLMSESGLVQFSSKFDSVKRTSGRVIGAKLEGRVVASGPDGLTIRGRDFYFHEKSLELHSDAPVEFSFQKHRGTAADGFKADLLPSAEPPRPDDLLAIAGFRRLMLRGLVEMHLAHPQSPLHVTCDEAFQFNPEQQIAWFQGNVQVERLLAKVLPDLLKCDDLYLVFENDSLSTGPEDSRSRGDAPGIMPILPRSRSQELSAAGPGAMDASRIDGRLTKADRDEWVMRELRATGKRVELNSPSNGLTAVMTSLIYDVVNRTARLASIAAAGKSAAGDLKSVFVRHLPSATDLNCPKLELIHDEKGQVIEAHGDGAGRMRRGVPGSNEVEFSAKWQQRFDLQRVPESDMDLLTLLGGAVLQQPTRKSGLKGEQIRFWFDRPSNDAATSQPIGTTRKQSNGVEFVSSKSEKPRTASERPVQSFRPRQLQAQDEVVVISPQMNAETKRFIVNFDDQSSAPQELASISKSRSRVRQAGGSPPVSSRKKSPPKMPTEPLQLNADVIRATVRWDGEVTSSANDAAAQPELTEVWTEGNVDIQQPNDGMTEPLRLLGDRLHLRNASREGEQVLHVFGQPAMIRARGFDIEGNEIVLDRPNNRTWVEGAGELRMPVKNDPFEGHELGSPTLLTVWWKEKMIFDGQTATFLDDVKAVLKNSRLKCEELEVVLTDKLSLRDDIGPSPTAEVERVLCKDGVVFDQTLYTDEELTEIRHGEFAKLTMHQTTGQTEGIGPGKIDLRRPGRGKRAALAPRAISQANRPLESEVANWEATRVTFQGKMIGNLRERQTKFQDRVHITYGPVANPLDTIDPDHLPKDGGDMECDALQILQVKTPGTQKSHIELEAKGNAKLEGRTFNARADEITFDESKELYTLRATGNRQATIWRQSTANGEPSEASAKTWRFIPSTNYLKADQTTGIRGPN